MDYKMGGENMSGFPNYPGLKTKTLRDLHDSISMAMAEDDGLPGGQKNYGVRELSDWRDHANRIEVELDKRGEKYHKLDWQIKK